MLWFKFDIWSIIFNIHATILLQLDESQKIVKSLCDIGEVGKKLFCFILAYCIVLRRYPFQLTSISISNRIIIKWKPIIPSKYHQSPMRKFNKVIWSLCQYRMRVSRTNGHLTSTHMCHYTTSLSTITPSLSTKTRISFWRWSRSHRLLKDGCKYL